jgi:hypothetical protein
MSRTPSKNAKGDEAGIRYTYCPGCDMRIVPGQEVEYAPHYDPWQTLWHRDCRSAHLGTRQS